MPTHPVRSRRIAVVGDSPVARGISGRLGAEPVVRAPGSTADFPAAEVAVLVGHTGDFARTGSRHVAERRQELVATVHADVADAVAAGARHIVGISSAMVNGAEADRAIIVDHEPRMASTDDGHVGDILTFEEALEDVATDFPGLRLTILRPAALVGTDIDTLITRHFEAPRILTFRGSSRDWQFLHVEDLADAIDVVIHHGLTGRLTVGALRDGEPDILDPATVAQAAGMRTIDLPASSAYATAERLHKVGALPTPASDMAFAVYSWTVNAQTVRDAGWVARWSSEECLAALLSQISGRAGVAGLRVGKRDAAALGAAGAAVALLGTAAIWKQARKLR